MNSAQKLRLLAAAAAVPLSMGVAFAQDAAEEDATIVVTGSRLPQTDLTSAAPVTVLDREEIDLTGASNVGELLRELPIASASPSEASARGGDGAARISLRGLGPINTLVLVNGRRVLANNAGGTVDLNSIPFEAVERVEVLQDGASAVYGSDAIAGVVNIIMRDDYEGLNLQAEYGISSRSDLANREIGLTFGNTFDRGSFVFSASWREADGNVIADRPISRDPDWRAIGGQNYRDPLPTRAAVTNIDPLNPGREMIIREGVAQATTLADFRDVVFPGTNDPITSGNDGINYWLYESSADEIETFNLWFSGDYELNDAVSAFVEASHNNRHSRGFLAPDYIGAVFGDPVTISAANDFNPFGRDLSVARTFIEENPINVRQSDVEASTYRFVGGLQGDWNDWHWDVAYNHQQLHQYTFGGRGLVRDLVRQAAGDSNACRAASNGCVPINLLGAEGSITQTMLNFVTADSFTDITSELDSISANVAGTAFTLPAGDVNVAFGVETRRERFSLNTDSISEVNGFTGRALSPDAFPPEREINEVYFETSVPLLADLPMVESLVADFAVRYSDYNQFGSTTNPKYGLRYRPIEDLLLRATYSTGFRAPTFTEAYGGQSAGFRNVTDPCRGANFATFPGCNNRQATTPTTGAFVTTGGNPNLQPEEAENFTAGAVWTPAGIEGLQMTLDYYRIEKSNIIGTANVNFMILQNAQDGTSFASRITRDANNSVFNVLAVRDNLLDQELRGVDLGVQYQTPEYDFGSLVFRVDVTYLDSFKISPAPLTPPVERVGTYTSESASLADYRSTGRVSWLHGPWTATYSYRYVGGVDATGFSIAGLTDIDSYYQHDLLFGYDLVDHETTLNFGIENVADEMPPFIESNYSNGFDDSTFNSRGRFYYVRISKDF